MTEPEIQTLHRMCVTALKETIAQAQKTCSLLETLEFPVSLDVWMEAVNHRSAENDAYDRYRIVREELFKALRPMK